MIFFQLLSLTVFILRWCTYEQVPVRLQLGQSWDLSICSLLLNLTSQIKIQLSWSFLFKCKLQIQSWPWKEPDFGHGRCNRPVVFAFGKKKWRKTKKNPMADWASDSALLIIGPESEPGPIPWIIVLVLNPVQYGLEVVLPSLMYWEFF